MTPTHVASEMVRDRSPAIMVRLDPSVMSRNPTRLFRKNTPLLSDGQSATWNCPAEATYWPGDRSLTKLLPELSLSLIGPAPPELGQRLMDKVDARTVCEPGSAIGRLKLTAS